MFAIGTEHQLVDVGQTGDTADALLNRGLQGQGSEHGFPLEDRDRIVIAAGHVEEAFIRAGDDRQGLVQPDHAAHDLDKAEHRQAIGIGIDRQHGDAVGHARGDVQECAVGTGIDRLGAVE